MGKSRFLLGYYLKRPEVIKAYKEIKTLENQDIETLKDYQNTKLRELISYAVKEIPYYKNLFNSLNLKAEDIQTTEDLIKIPILTKEIIKKNPQDFISKNYKKRIIKGSTGGSTGIPLKYIMSNKDYSRGVALLFRGFEFGGYRLGDSVSIIAGSSLVTKNQSFKGKLQDWIMNFNHFSSYGMSENDLKSFYNYLNKKKSKFLRGYASSLFLLAKYMKQNDLKLNYQMKAIFSTSEKLLPKQREVIESIFNTKVFDNYGLNDGGITAFECRKHNGMHIDYERSILEITNDLGSNQIVGEEGKILATSLFNYAMPFIRYETGDLGEISLEKCECKCSRPLLKGITGRVTDYLKLNGIYIGSPVLTVLMGKIDVEYYQIIQTAENGIQINLIKGKGYDQIQENFIKDSLSKHVGKIIVDFIYLSNTQSNSSDRKHKFIVNDDFK